MAVSDKEGYLLSHVNDFVVMYDVFKDFDINYIFKLLFLFHS